MKLRLLFALPALLLASAVSYAQTFEPGLLVLYFGNCPTAHVAAAKASSTALGVAAVVQVYISGSPTGPRWWLQKAGSGRNGRERKGRHLAREVSQG